MAVTTFSHDKAKELGLSVNSYSSFPAECFTHKYVGCVLDTYERNGYDDSDFFAIVWDEALGQTREVMYATTRGWTYLDSATVDATDEVRAKAAAYWKSEHRRILESATRRKLSAPSIGAQVIVKRGRKVPVGFCGKVIATKERPVYMSYSDRTETWVTVMSDSGSWDVLAKHCDVVPDPERVETGVAAALAKFDASHYPLDASWRSMPYQSAYYSERGAA